MKRLPLIAGLVCLLSAGCSGPEQVLPTSPGARLAADVPAEVAAEFKLSTGAYNAGDLEGFLSIYAEEATLAQRDGFIVGKSAIRMLYAERMRPDVARDTLVLERLDATELAPDVALIRGVYRTTKGGSVSWRGAMTVIMKRNNGQWRIVHDHSN